MMSCAIKDEVVVKKWLMLIFMLMKVSAVIAAPRVEIYPVLSIVPAKKTNVIVVNTKTVLIPYTITNNRSYRVNDISITPDLGVAPDLLSVSIANNTCTGVLANWGSCSFTVVLQGKNKTGSTALAPSLCIFGGRFCSVPAVDNVVAVATKVLKSIVITASTEKMMQNTPQSLSAVGTFVDGTTGDITSMVTWRSSNVNVIKIGGSTGLATAVAEGTSTVTAKLDDITSNTVTLTVSKDR